MHWVWWSVGRCARTSLLLIALGASACGNEDEFPQSQPVANPCAFLTGDEVAVLLPHNDGGKEAGAETQPDFWARGCDYSDSGLHYVHLSVSGASSDRGNDFLKLAFDSAGVGGQRQAIDGVGDEAAFWISDPESGVTARAKGYLVELSALTDPLPGKDALAPLTNKAIGRMP